MSGDCSQLGTTRQIDNICIIALILRFRIVLFNVPSRIAADYANIWSETR